MLVGGVGELSLGDLDFGRRAVVPFVVPQREAVHAVREAITGYFRIDLLLEVLAAFDVLPARTTVVEVEPATRETSLELSPVCDAALGGALELVRTEVRSARVTPA